MYHEGYLRVKSNYVQHLTDIVFTPSYVIYLNDEGLSSPQNRIRVELIAASPEFDKYNKSLYEQKSMIVYDEDISSIFYQPKNVYSNIENGNGIFAGFSKTSLCLIILIKEQIHETPDYLLAYSMQPSIYAQRNAAEPDTLR